MRRGVAGYALLYGGNDSGARRGGILARVGMLLARGNGRNTLRPYGVEARRGFSISGLYLFSLSVLMSTF